MTQSSSRADRAFELLQPRNEHTVQCTTQIVKFYLLVIYYTFILPLPELETNRNFDFFAIFVHNSCIRFSVTF